MKTQGHTTGTLIGGALRRWISVLCVSLFVFTAYAHAGCLVQPIALDQTVQNLSDLSGGAADDTALPGQAAAHCHGCTVAAVPIAPQSLAVSDNVAKPIASLSGELSAFDRPFDTPPPKA